MRIAQHISELIGNTPLVQLNSVVPPGAGRVVAKVEYLNPGAEQQGPDRGEDDRRRRGQRRAQAGRHDRRADLGQHRRRPGPGRPAARLPLRLRLPGQGQRGQAERAARLRRRGRGVPDRGAARASGQLLQRLRPTGQRDRRRVEARPVLQPAGPGQPLRDHRPGDLGRHRRPGHALRRRHRHRRDHHRRRAATSRTSPAGRCASSAPTRKDRCIPAAPGGRIWSRASARTSGRRPTTRRCPTRSSRSRTPIRST